MMMQNIALLERIYPGRRAELKRQILNCALQQFIQQGIESTTIEMIRDAAETSVGAIYHHFKHKEGIVSALYISALKDQATQRMHALQQSQNLKHGLYAVIHSYLDWVEQYPDFARFLYAASYSVQQGIHAETLKQENLQRNLQLGQWLALQPDAEYMTAVPVELRLSLMIGPTESYCRAWLSGRVSPLPTDYANVLAQAAWQSLNAFQM